MKRRKYGAALALAMGFTIALTGCNSGGGGGGGGNAEEPGEPVAGAPDWCGSKEISFALLDGFGGNSWRLITTASGEEEVKKCPSVTEYLYADGQGDTQKAISDIQGMVAKGVDAMVVFPDAGQAVLPALRSAYNAGVVTVPYRTSAGGEDGVDYDLFVGADFAQDALNWSDWIKENFPDGANILFLSGPPGNSQGVTERETFDKELPADKYIFLGAEPFEVTNWDPSLTQQVLTAAIAQYPQIDVIVSDFGPSLVGALPEFEKSDRSIPAIVATDGNVLACFYDENKEDNPDFELMTVATGNDNVRLAIQHAVALATGGVPPEETVFAAPTFEDSTDDDPSPVKCEPDLPADIYLSAEMSPEDQAALLQ
jgi:ribose transport system substrate-binding protein